MDEVQANGARQLQEGWMHIHGTSLSLSIYLELTSEIFMLADERNIPPLGRIGDPDDIIASVRVQGGKVRFHSHGYRTNVGLNCDVEILSQFLAETYQPMPAYRMCTSDGVLKLTEGLAQKLKQVLERDG